MSAQKPLLSCKGDGIAPLETINTSSVLDIRENRSKTLEPATTSVECQFDGFWSLERCLKPRLASTNGSCSKRRDCMRSTDLTILISWTGRMTFGESSGKITLLRTSS